MLTLLLPYPPSTNRLWRYERGVARLSDAAKAWIAQARLEARRAACSLLQGDACVELILHPRLTLKGQASKTRIDVDGPIKIGMDALIGCAYADDKQVVAVSCRVGDPQPGGGLTLRVWGAGEEMP